MARSPIEIMVDRACGIEPPPTAKAIAEMPPDMPDLLLAVADAAVAWWKMHRPYRWTKKKHLQNPTINTLTPAERKLALEVAEWVKMTT